MSTDKTGGAVTQWFEPSEKPVHAGVYEMQGLPHPFHYWDGKDWCACAGTKPSDPELSSRTKCKSSWSYMTRKLWRGLAEKPE